MVRALAGGENVAHNLLLGYKVFLQATNRVYIWAFCSIVIITRSSYQYSKNILLKKTVGKLGQGYSLLILKY